jgi:hypothetical protein
METLRKGGRPVNAMRPRRVRAPAAKRGAGEATGPVAARRDESPSPPRKRIMLTVHQPGIGTAAREAITAGGVTRPGSRRGGSVSAGAVPEDAWQRPSLVS